jgi:putative membrane protein
MEGHNRVGLNSMLGVSPSCDGPEAVNPLSLRDFFAESGRSAVGAAVREVESHTSAEVVVAVRKRAERYRQTDYLVGSVLAFVTLLVLLFHPAPFAVAAMPFEVAGAFVLGVLVSAFVPAVQVRLTAKSVRERAVAREARAAFYDLGVSRTTGRNGILVFVALAERAVYVVPDVGIDVTALGEGWSGAIVAMQNAVSSTMDFERFVTALRSLGPVLGAALPRAEDDVNELPDEPGVA